MSIAEKLTAIAENEQKVFDAGKKAEYDRFWDVLQENGAINHDYRNAFGPGWTKDNFYPKYNIKGKNAGNGTFRFFGAQRGELDLAQRLEECGVVLDTSQCGTVENIFYGAYISRVPAISAVSANQYGLLGSFAYSRIHTIEKLILRDDGATAFNGSFTSCSFLANITIEGKIGKNGFHVADCVNLTYDSLMSIINALEAKTEGTWTVTLGTTNLAKLTDAEKAIATQKGWTLA